MGKNSSEKTKHPSGLPKCATGIQGLDEITLGGLPRGRTTLLCGGAGCGKTLLGMEFLVRGSQRFGEPGVCISFEETAGEIASNVAALGFDVPALIRKEQLSIDHIDLERSLIEEAGEYDLEALFVRIAHAVDSVGAKRVLLDGVESLFAGLTNEGLLRAELRRLFRWLKDKGLTAVVTAERGQGSLTRYGLEEYISDCVILLDHHVSETVLTRRLRVVKYRGSTHGTNEYPFLIESDGISVLPVTSIDLKHAASKERVSTGIPGLDAMFSGRGYFRGSSILISGTAGTGKTSLTAHFANAACVRGESCLFFSFEESASQVIRNMRSIGLNLQQWVDKGLLHFCAARPTTFGLEMHLARIHKMVVDIKPSTVVVDPVTGLLNSGSPPETRSMLLRLVDFLKSKQITAVMTTLTHTPDWQEQTEVNVSSLVDAWLMLRDIESGGERNRGLYILKARGLAHSNQIREFHLSDQGVELREVYLGDAGLLTGSARLMQEAKDESAAILARQEIERKQFLLRRKRKVLDAQIAALQLDLETEEMESQQIIAEEEQKLHKWRQDRSEMAKSRHVNPAVRGQSAQNGRTDGARE
ncbi:MAG TPA: circadian clock protein KaiC [Candidatus Sulfopaludibacter sp.]|jgi:circadian clock protein KaiC|nr:circadian clock protein KaiC [Candidatus Sulfopaludibacter sp.]